jgi:hypothetical protein
MTLSVTVPDSLFQKAAELAARQNISVERLISSALAEQIAGWERLEQMAARARPAFNAAFSSSNARKYSSPYWSVWRA